MICNCLQIIRFFVFLTIGFHDENKQIAWRDDLASAAFGKITAVYVPVGCLNYVHFDDMGRHMSLSIEHFFGRALHLMKREECLQNQSPYNVSATICYR